MAILLSNDDGISAAGLQALKQSLSPLEETWVVAPDRNQSAVSHALTLYRPLRIDEVAKRCFTVDGTPTDCVKLGIDQILPMRPRLVVSGINHGANLGDDVTYSGTVSAAFEATLLGVPAIAVSQMGRVAFDFSVAASFVRALVARVLVYGLPPDTLLNINVPEGEVTGYAITRQGKRRYDAEIIEKVDPRGRKYYWIGGDEPGHVVEEGTDFAAVHSGLISITPLHLDLTNYASFNTLAELNVQWP